MFFTVCFLSRDTNGTRLVRITCRHIPKLHTSAVLQWSFPSNISGGQYAIVPNLSLDFSSTMNIFESPKSISLGRAYWPSLLVIMMFSSLMSLCTIPKLWRYFTALRIEYSIFLALASFMKFLFMNSKRSRPSRYSRTIKKFLSSSMTSTSLIIYGWLPITFRSSISVIYSCISNLSIAVLSICFTATDFPVASCFALYTFPKDPSPKA